MNSHIETFAATCNTILVGEAKCISELSIHIDTTARVLAARALLFLSLPLAHCTSMAAAGMQVFWRYWVEPQPGKGVFVDFDDDTSATLSSVFLDLRQREVSAEVRLQWTPPGFNSAFVYKYSFEEMTQTREDNGQVRGIAAYVLVPKAMI